MCGLPPSLIPTEAPADASRAPVAAHSCCRFGESDVSTWRTSEEKREEADGQEEESQEPERESQSGGGATERGKGPRA